jgi:hypothetical protein
LGTGITVKLLVGDRGLSDTVNGMPLYIEQITPDSDFATFQHCPNLVTTD